MIISNWLEISFKSLNDWKGKEDEIKTLLEHSIYFSYFQWIHLIYEFSETIKAAKHYCCSIITKWHFLESWKKYFFSLWLFNVFSLVKLFCQTFCSISLFATIGGNSAKISFSLRFCSFVTLDPLIANALINLYRKCEFIRWN